MRILLLNHGKAGEFRGGDAVQIRHTAHWLQRFGHRVEVQQSNSPVCAGFDLVHVFNCRHPEAFRAQMQAALQQGVPVVVSPIWISLGEALWGSRTAMAVLKQALREPAHLPGQLEHLRQRTMVLNLGDGEHHYPVGNAATQQVYRQIGSVLGRASGLLPNSLSLIHI